MKFIVFISVLILSIIIGMNSFDYFISTVLFSLLMAINSIGFFYVSKKTKILNMFFLVLAIISVVSLFLFIFNNENNGLVSVKWLLLMLFSFSLNFVYLIFMVNARKKSTSNNAEQFTPESIGGGEYPSWIVINPSTGLKMNGVLDISGNALGQEMKNDSNTKY